MYKVDVMYELDPEYLFDNYPKQLKVRNSKGKQVKISDEIFELMINEGLIKKNDDGYIFVGKNEDLLELKKKKK